MKKLVVALALSIAGVSAWGANLDWQYTAAAADEGSAIYVLLGSAVSSFSSVSDVTGNANLLSGGTGTIEKKGSGSRATYAASGTVADSRMDDSASYYYVIVKSDNSGYFISPTQSATGKTYADGETGSGAANLTNKSMTYTAFSGGGGGGGDVPEPTSGLLLLVGGAMLALRRKQK